MKLVVLQLLLGFEADQVIPAADLGEYESREVAIAGALRIEGGQYLQTLTFLSVKRLKTQLLTQRTTHS